MRAGEIGIGAHIEIVGLGCIEDIVHHRRTCQTDRSRGKSGIFVGIVRGIDSEMSFQHTAHGEVTYGIDYRRARLERDTTLQTIEVDRCDSGVFG